jgi:FKBP-type peptidyl-prolyl cis-trans isomerase FkpA
MTITRRHLMLAAGLTVVAASLPSWAFAQKSAAQQEWETSQADFLAANLKKPGWKATASGLQFKKIKAAPKGAQPGAETPVTIAYEGKTGAGTVFDSSEGFDLKVNEMVKGMREGLQMMRVGETWEFAMPAELGYGDRSGPRRPAGSALVFHVTLVKAG